MSPHKTNVNDNEPIDSASEAAYYVHSVAPDPRRLDPLDNPRIIEEGCIGITEQKKYYEFMNTKGSSVFIKRNLTPSEYIVTKLGNLVLPYRTLERMKNEAAAIRYIQSHTTIPTPNIRCAFEDRGRYYIVTDYAPGVTMGELPDDRKPQVIEELLGYIKQMRMLKSKSMGGFAGDVILPYRVGAALPRDQVLKLRDATMPEFVLCHNDLSQHNVMVDEVTLKITAILDWEYAGFFPPEFDGAFYLRPGPSVAINAEEDDVQKLLEILDHWKA